jgi:hypothetical protein
MTKPARHHRILAFPYTDSLASARLDALYEESQGQRRDLVMDYQELCLLGPPELFSRNGQPCERVQGNYVPRRLRFAGLRWLERTGLYTQLETIPLDHDARSLRGILYFCPSGKDALCLLFNGSDEPATLMFSARRFIQEDRSGPVEPVDFVRDWSPPPPLPARLVPAPKQLHHRYSGDPITIRLGARTYHQRFFIGGLDYQREHRPAVDAVLNLGEEPSRWVTATQSYPNDRWDCKGEEKHGMDVAEITQEAQWVIERLRAGQRILVHCSAGLNRSATLCCGVLILLEGISAEAALDRVREYHPWARPDTHHWLALRWLAYTSSAST